MWEAYSHEVSSCGYWPGPPGDEGAFYAYAYPEPPGYRDTPVTPGGACWDNELGEFVLPYELVRTAPDPDAVLLSSSRAPTKPPPSPPTGTATRSSDRTATAGMADTCIHLDIISPRARPSGASADPQLRTGPAHDLPAMAGPSTSGHAQDRFDGGA